MSGSLDRWRQLVRDESGMSLIEVMIAVFVLSVAVLALAGVATDSLVDMRLSRGRQAATDVASGVIEDLRRDDFASLALDGSTVGVACSPETDEPYVTTSTGGGTPHVEQRSEPFAVEVETRITWYDDPDDGDESCSGQDDRGVKRVEVEVRWDDGGQTYSVSESTLVVDANRGLPLPDFDLGTPEQALNFTDSEVANQEEKCIAHLLRNTGADDSYDWEPALVSSSDGDTTLIDYSPTAFRTDHFELRAFFEAPPQDPPLNPEDTGFGTSDPNLDAMSDADADGRPETSLAVPTGDEGRLWTCYRPLDNDPGDLAEQQTLQITVHSRYDPNRTEAVEQVVTVGADEVSLYLNDTEDGTSPIDHDRCAANCSQALADWEVATMTMGSSGLLGPGLADWDQDVEAEVVEDPQDGIRLVAGLDNLAGIFHEQFTTATRLTSSATASLYLGTDESLHDNGNDSNSDPIDLRLTVQHLDDDETTVLDTLTDRTVRITGIDSQWDRVDIPLTLSGDLTFDANAYLRLILRCPSTSGTDCHLAFDDDDADGTGYESALVVTKQ